MAARGRTRGEPSDAAGKRASRGALHSRVTRGLPLFSRKVFRKKSRNAQKERSSRARDAPDEKRSGRKRGNGTASAKRKPAKKK